MQTSASSLPKTLPAFFWHFIKKQPWPFLVFFLAPITVVIDTNVVPYALKLIIDGISAHTDNRETIFETISPALWLGALSWIGFASLIRMQNWWQSRIIPTFEAQIRMSVFDYVMHHSHRYFSDQLAGKIATQISELPRAIEVIRMIFTWNVIATASTITVFIITLFYIHALFAWIFFLWMVLQVGGVLLAARMVYKASEKHAEDKSFLNGAIVDTLSNSLSVKLFARQPYEQRWVGRLQEVEKESYRKLIVKTNWMRSIMDVAFILFFSLICYLMISYWQSYQFTTGTFILIFNTIWGITFQLWHLGEALPDLFSSIGTAKQALELVRTPHELQDAPDAKPLIVTKGEISFQNVSFHYNKGQSIFENKNLTISSGQKVGLVGFSGSGKTTFVNLILRFYEVEKGGIFIDGQNIAHVTQESLRNSIAMIPQETGLFHRSLMENIRYGRVDATDDEVMEASRKAHCEEFINRLPQGYQSLVGERGTKLSGGQRQRIAIARAFLKNAPILILDEATSALDSVTEQLIQESLHELIQGCTTIVIAHRLSTLSQMDRIIVFDEGRIVEDGTHEKLLQAEGHYAKMWRMQAGGFLPEKNEWTKRNNIF